MTKRPPTVARLPVALADSTSLTSLISSAATYRSSVRPVGTLGISPHQSGASPLTVSSFILITRSGVPIAQALRSAYTFGGGMSAGLPRAAPGSAHFAIVAISSSLNDGSLWNFWMPMFFSTYHGGMTPAFGPLLVGCLMARD